MAKDEQDFTPDEKIEGKTCPECGEFKQLKDFYTRGRHSKYLAAYCKSCHAKAFKHNAIVCPYCNNKLHFFGVKGNKIIREKDRSKIASDLVKDVKKVTKKQPTNSLKELLQDDDD